jgi:hypothetical protein
MQDSTRQRVLVFPSYGPDDGASRLRGWTIATALRDCGWRATAVPPQLTLSQRLRLIRRERPSVLLLQQARHPLNRPALYCELDVPAVFDLDDADWLDVNREGMIVECCRDAAAVIAGSRFVGEFCRRHNSQTTVVWTGAPMPMPGTRSSMPFPPPQNRSPIVTWAQADPLNCPHEAAFVADVMLELARRGARFTLRLYGRRAENAAGLESYLAPLRKAGIAAEAYPFADYRRFTDSLREVAVGLQPVSPQSAYSQGKSFGKVLAYVASGVAVVAANALDHPLFFRDGENGLLMPHDVNKWARAIEQLLYDPQMRRRLAQRAYADAGSKLSTAAAAGAVDPVLRTVVRRAQRRGVAAAEMNRASGQGQCCAVT